MKFIKGDTNAWGLPIEPDYFEYELEDWDLYISEHNKSYLLDVLDYYSDFDFIKDVLDNLLSDSDKLSEMNE